MRKKVFILGLVGMMLMMVIAGCGGNNKSSSPAKMEQGANGEYNLKFSTVLSETSSWYKLGKRISERMAAETNGKVKITVYPNEQLSGGNQTKGLELIMNGSTDMDLRSGMLWAVVDKRMGAVSLPFFYDSFADIDKQFAGEGGNALKKVMEEHGVKLFGFAEGGWRQLYTGKKKVSTLEDMKDLKARLASVPMNMETFKALGANPIVMNWSEAFTGLQQGTVDGIECPLSAAYESSVQEVCKNATMWNYSYDSGLLSMNLATWNKMPPELQKTFTKVIEECIAEQVKSERAHNEEILKTLRDKHGVKIYELSDAERAKFKQASSSVVANFEKAVGKEFVDKFRVGK